MAIALLEPGWEEDYDGRPPVRPVACVGEIVAHETLPEGRSNILLKGIGRIGIVQELPQGQLYRVVRARLLRDRRPRRDLRDDHAALMALCNRVAEHLPAEHAAMLRQVAAGEPEPGVACDLLGAALLGDTEAKQALLECLDVGHRLRRLSAELAALVSRLSARAAPN
jgi:Lon protease-like protein